MSGWAGSDYENIRQRVFEEYKSLCNICDEFVDITLQEGLPMSPTVDHVVPISKGGAPLDILNMRPCHDAHNKLKGTKPLNVARAIYAESAWKTSRPWFQI